MRRKHFHEEKLHEKYLNGEGLVGSYQQEQDRLEYMAAKKIQSLFRGYIYRYHCSHLEAQNSAARKIQRAWRNHLIQRRLQNIKKIIAIAKITKFVINYKRRMTIKRGYQELQKYEPVLRSYPSKCRKPIPPKRKKPIDWKKKSEIGRPIKLNKKGKKGKVSQSDSIPKPMVAERRTTNYKSGGSGPPRKRTILVELPPPWHNKDARRISQSQQDELIYNQRNNVQWVRNDIMPTLMKKINGHLDYRDELLDKNEKFRTRVVTKPFITSTLRSPTYLTDVTPRSITFIKDTGIFALALTTGIIYLKIMSYNEDQIFKKDDFDIDSPLFDVAIYPRSGFVYGLDHKWCIRMINNGITVLKKQLNPDITVPHAKHFLSFDKFGILWVNLIPQKSDFLGIDPLTLQITIKVNLDNLAQTHRFMRKNLRIIPLSLKEPVGFAASFNGMSDIVLFSPNFGKARHLRHPNMKEFPSIRQSQNKLFVWSTDRVIYVYEIGNSIELIQLQGSFKVEHTPIDVCASAEPDLIYVSQDDCTLKAYLGEKAEHALRYPESKMTSLEKTFADSMLGPNVYTKSRPSFLMMAMHRFSSIPIQIDSWSISPKLTVVAATFSDASIHSAWFYNNSQQVSCDEFDRFKVKETHDTKVCVVSEFRTEESKILKKRGDFLELFNFMVKFDIISNKGQIQNIFLPRPPSFSLTKLVSGYCLRSFFPFIPESSNGQLSSYEVFHFLKRSGILPDKLSEFSVFLTRLTPQNVHRTLLAETTYNIKLPVITTGIYNAITNFMFSDKEVGSIIQLINPLSQLRDSLSVFTISSVSDQQFHNNNNINITTTPSSITINNSSVNINDSNEQTKAISTPRRWLSLYEKNELNKRLLSLILMEDLVKHELMGRVQRNIDEAFNKNMYDRMVPVPSIDIHQHANLNETKNMTFNDYPNRNPLLDNRMHKSIYHTWSNRTLFSRDLNAGVDLRAIHIPTSQFMQSIVQSHFEFVKKVAKSSKKITSEVYDVSDLIDNTSRIVITEDSKSLPLSHYLIIHSYLGANSRLILAARSILSRILTVLYQLHKSGIILRTLIPDNILLNAQNGTVTLSNVFDCQQIATANTKAVYLPLPEKFADYSNPFLPPEYFYEPPRKWTTAFDIWQFGILLLYLITGFLPSSYGAELMKHLDEDQKLKCRQAAMNESNQIIDPPLYPHCNFFYDWLKGCTVLVQADRKSWVGDIGECFITTDRQVPASILELDHYHLLPYKNTKIKYDESRLFLEIIASCLQIEPEKRPTVEKLLRTIPFNQANQIGDILAKYMKHPNSDVFVREFFSPTLDNLTDESFPFALGIISALVFHDEMADEDAAYSFPLDSRAAERVTKSLFEVKFMDRLVIYVLKRIEKRITYNDVNPNISFKDEAFNSFLHLLERFVHAVEHGQGSLLSHVDEVVLTLLALYTGNPRLRYSSEYFLKNSKESLNLASTGSASVFVFTHTQVKPIVNYALQDSSYIFTTLKRTTEHNDNYFNQFLNFGEKVFVFANAMVHSIEKQRANAICTLLNYWGNGSITHIIRLFIDFRVPQMAIHCFLNSSARVKATGFINECFNAIRLKSFEPTYILLQRIICQATVYLFCGIVVRSNMKDELKYECMDLIRAIIYGDNATAVTQLIIADVFWTLVENGKSAGIFDLLIEAIFFSSKFVIQVIFSSSSLKRLLKQCDIDLNPNFDFNVLNNSNIDIEETLEVSKRLSSTLFIRQSSLPIEMVHEKPPIDLAITFLINSINLVLNESEKASIDLDDIVLQSTRFDLKGTTYLKAKSTSKKTDFSDIKETISELCDSLLHLFRCICFYCREPESKSYSKRLTDFILNIIVAPIPVCQSMPHPAYLIHHSIQKMALHCLIDLPESSPVRSALLAMQEIFPRVMLRDIMFVMQCVDKDQVEVQLTARYPVEKQIRMKMFQTIMIDKQTTNYVPILRFIVVDMLHNAVSFEGNTKLGKDWKYPIRTEALNMVLFLFSMKEKLESNVKRLVDELIISNVIEEEKKLNDTVNDQVMNNSSIVLLKTIIQCPSLFDEKIIKPAKQLLDVLSKRFTRDLSSVAALNPSNKTANNQSSSNLTAASNSIKNAFIAKSKKSQDAIKKKIALNSVMKQSQSQSQKIIQKQIQKKMRASLNSKNLLSATETPRKNVPVSAFGTKNIKVTKSTEIRTTRSSLNDSKK